MRASESHWACCCWLQPSSSQSIANSTLPATLSNASIGATATGGSIDVGGPAIANGIVVTTSGYGQWGGMRGNVLLVFSPDGK